MNELKITVSAPELAQALNNLADALKNGAGNAQPAVAAPTAAAPAPQAQPAPVPAPAPQSAPAPMPAPVPPAPAPVAAPVPAPAPAPQPAPVAAPVPQATPGPATGVTLDAIINAGAGLVEKGMMAQVVALLGKYGLQAVNQLQPAQYEPFAAELRALGANL